VRVETLVVGDFQTNCYVISEESSGEAVVIDAAEPADVIIDHLERSGLTASVVVVTHAHFDHIAGIPAIQKAFPDVQVAASSEAGELLGRPTMNLSLFLAKSAKYPAPDIKLEHGGDLKAGGLELSVISLDGHAPGSICLLWEGEPRQLFTGDTLFAGGIGRTDLPGGQNKGLLEGIQRRIMSLPDETVVYPGHGPQTTVGGERSNPFLVG
jgi:hydroxyacylglutathione hydrolase